MSWRYDFEEHKLYPLASAEAIGRRRVCNAVGHDLKIGLDHGRGGGVQGSDGRRGEAIAACDMIECRRCDGKFSVTYPDVPFEPPAPQPRGLHETRHVVVLGEGGAEVLHPTRCRLQQHLPCPVDAAVVRTRFEPGAYGRFWCTADADGRLVGELNMIASAVVV